MDQLNASKIDRDEKTPPESMLTKTITTTGDVTLVTAHRLQLVPSSRYRHPGDVQSAHRGAGWFWVGTLAAGRSGPQVSWSGPAGNRFRLGTDSAERLLIGLVQVAFVPRGRRSRDDCPRTVGSGLLTGLLAGAPLSRRRAVRNLVPAGDKHPHTMA